MPSIPPPRTLPARPSARGIVIGLCLVIATTAAYWPLLDNDFVNFDDYEYVTLNPDLQAGLTLPGVWWALTTTHAGNWHPLTWLSLQLDFEVFGLSPRGYHLHNLLLHAANSCLLFWVFRRLTGAVGRSAVLALLFALHPLHVESVAWVSERKDVLSTFFFLLTLWAYAAYAALPGLLRYGAVLAALALGLLAKPVLVTTPCVLLLLDYWPLGRWHAGQELGAVPGPRVQLSFWRLVLEKIPLLALVAVSCLVTVTAQRRAAFVSSLEEFSLPVRLGNALVAYVRYLGMTFCPVGLAAYYPHPGPSLGTAQAALAALLLLTFSLLALWRRRRQPYLLVGWLWYLGTLVPVIGLVQVASQALADRYTYVPLIGIFLLLVWGVADLLSWRPHAGAVLAPVFAALLLLCGLLTWLQVHYWRNSVTLWQHTVEETKDNYVAHNYLGSAFWDLGESAEAVRQFERTLEIPQASPGARAYARAGLGDASLLRGDVEEAISSYEAALQLAPEQPQIHTRLGMALRRKGEYAAAAEQFGEALRLGPADVGALESLAEALNMQGKHAEAFLYLRQAARIKSGGRHFR